MTDLPEKRRRGRKKKASSEKLEQFTIRLSPHAKFSAEVLACWQGRSLSQTIEWALETAVAHVRVGRDDARVMTLGDAIESSRSLAGWERIHKLYQVDPTLVSFEDRHACELVELSGEYRELASVRARDDLWGRWSLLVESVWPKLLADSTKMQVATKLRAGTPLLAAVELGEGYTPQPNKTGNRHAR